ncbi:MAG: acetate--CoA ligase family protein [Candidatus Aenigmatarchaeota archaeon]
MEFLGLDASLKFIKSYGIPIVEYKLAKNRKEVVEFANKIGYPVVLKLDSKDIAHKTDVGGVFPNLKSNYEVEKSFLKIISNIKSRFPNATINGIVVQKMVEDGIEVMIGGKLDEQFGQTITFGSGGILAELIEDISIRVCPITKSIAEEMIRETKIYRLLQGYRGFNYDVKAVVEVLLKVSKMLEKNYGIKEIDINPLFVLRKNAFAADVRVVVD